MRRRLALVVAAAALSSPGAASAQGSVRIQASWVRDHALGAVLGWEVRKPIGAAPPATGNGPRVIDRKWQLAAMAAVGVNVDGPGTKGVGPLGYAHVGIMRKLGDAREWRVGLVGAAYVPARAYGPALRADVMDVGAVQAGWMFDGGLGVAIDVAARFVRDLL